MSFKIIMTTCVIRPCFSTQHQTCKTKTNFLVSDRSWPKTDGLRPHHWCCFLWWWWWWRWWYWFDNRGRWGREGWRAGQPALWNYAAIQQRVGLFVGERRAQCVQRLCFSAFYAAILTLRPLQVSSLFTIFYF